ncbi:hypothetical protein J6590_059181 [Homalodisca vitripennis]|nr:hypothetical protein J6590_059181 [Homalodisca vitripennis]
MVKHHTVSSSSDMNAGKFRSSYCCKNCYVGVVCTIAMFDTREARRPWGVVEMVKHHAVSTSSDTNEGKFRSSYCCKNCSMGVVCTIAMFDTREVRRPRGVVEMVKHHAVSTSSDKNAGKFRSRYCCKNYCAGGLYNCNV